MCVASYIKSLDVGKIFPIPMEGKRISPIDMSVGGGGGTGGLRFRGSVLRSGRCR